MLAVLLSAAFAAPTSVQVSINAGPRKDADRLTWTATDAAVDAPPVIWRDDAGRWRRALTTVAADADLVHVTLLVEEQRGRRWEVLSQPTLSIHYGETGAKFVYGVADEVVVDARFYAERPAGEAETTSELRFATFAEQVADGAWTTWLPADRFGALRCDDAEVKVSEQSGVRFAALTLRGVPTEAGAQRTWRCEGGTAVVLRVW